MRDGVKTIDSKTIEVLVKYIVKQLIIYFVYVLIKLVIGRSQTCGIIGWGFLLAPFRKTEIKLASSYFRCNNEDIKTLQ